MKRKILLSILAIVVILIIILAVHTIENFYIIKDLKKNFEVYANSTNHHINSVVTNSDGTKFIIDCYQKDDKALYIMYTESELGFIKVSKYSNQGVIHEYRETSEGKFAMLENATILDTKVKNALYNESTGQLLYFCLVFKFDFVEYNGKNCVLIKDYLVHKGEQKFNLYIEKDTGLPIKEEHGTANLVTTYEFNDIEDYIFEEPDISEFIIVNGE